MIIVITFSPLLFERRLRIHIPPELQLAAIVFASLFLSDGLMHSSSTIPDSSGGKTAAMVQPE